MFSGVLEGSGFRMDAEAAEELRELQEGMAVIGLNGRMRGPESVSFGPPHQIHRFLRRTRYLSPPYLCSKPPTRGPPGLDRA